MSSLLARASRSPGLFARLLAGAAAAALLSGPAMAQALDPEVEVDELVVAGSRGLPGQALGDIMPEVTLSPRDIQAYGAASVSELLDALAPQLSSGQGSGGHPVMLIDGARVSGFSEIRDLPTEAIVRVDILPEEVSLKYGYPAEQKVVNLVLRRRFRALMLEARGSTPTQDGGGQSVQGRAGQLRILNGRRLMVDAKAQHETAILESDRGLSGDQRAWRSLRPESSEVTLNAVYAKPLGEGASTTVNGLFETTDSEARLGGPAADGGSYLRRSDTQDARLAGLVNGAVDGWQWSATASVERNLSKSATDRDSGGATALEHTRSDTVTAQTDVVFNKSLWTLPAGQVSATLTARASSQAFTSEASRLDGDRSSDLDRSIGQVQASFDAPLTRDGEGLGEAFGKLSANLNLGYQRLSDFGDLATLGYGLNWTPAKPLRVLASFSRTDQAPTMSQLGDPLTTTPDARVFDFRTGETVSVSRLSGGSPGLDGGRRDVFKLGVAYKPFDDVNLRLQANYVATRDRDMVTAFPSASTQVEAAFPDRFIRDADGVLLAVDARPVNFARQDRDELRWGFNYSRSIRPTPGAQAEVDMRRRAMMAARGQSPDSQSRDSQSPDSPSSGGAAASSGQAQGGAPQGPRPGGEDDGPPPGPPPSSQGSGGQAMGGPPGGSPGGGPGGGFRGGPGGAGGVFRVSLYHTVAFRDEVQIRPGLPVLDLLDGGAIGSGGGSPRHQLDFQAALTRNGLGASLDAEWRSATTIDGTAGGDDLRFSDLTTVDLRLFADIGRQRFARGKAWARGLRATLSVDNLFDAREEVRSAAGTTPVSYQPDVLDPVGRSVRVTLRKLIF